MQVQCSCSVAPWLENNTKLIYQETLLTVNKKMMLHVFSGFHFFLESIFQKIKNTISHQNLQVDVLLCLLVSFSFKRASVDNAKPDAQVMGRARRCIEYRRTCVSPVEMYCEP